MKALRNCIAIQTQDVDMKKLVIVVCTFLICSCGQSQEEREKIAAVACSIMGETRNMDSSIRVREMNDAREKIGGEPFLSGDEAIKISLEWGLCEVLVLNENYDERLQSLQYAKSERYRIVREKRAEEKRIALEEQRIAAEKRAEEKRIADSKPKLIEKFHSNGKLKSRINFQSKSDGGKRHGLFEGYYSNGVLEFKKIFIDGKEHGLSERYYKSGLLQQEINFKQGKLDGPFKSFDVKGRLYDIKCFNNDEKVKLSYCEE